MKVGHKIVIRENGIYKCILFHILRNGLLLWGGLMSILMSIIYFINEIYIKGGEIIYSHYLYFVLIWFIGGLFFGLFEWIFDEIQSFGDALLNRHRPAARGARRRRGF